MIGLEFDLKVTQFSYVHVSFGMTQTILSINYLTLFLVWFSSFQPKTLSEEMTCFLVFSKIIAAISLLRHFC